MVQRCDHQIASAYQNISALIVNLDSFVACHTDKEGIAVLTNYYIKKILFGSTYNQIFNWFINRKGIAQYTSMSIYDRYHFQDCVFIIMLIFHNIL